MAEPTDRVQLIKQESTALGGDDADAAEWGSNPIEPQEDAIEAAGVYLQDAANRDEAVLIWRDGDVIKAKDVTYGTVELLGASAGSGITAAQHKACGWESDGCKAGKHAGNPAYCEPSFYSGNEVAFL